MNATTKQTTTTSQPNDREAMPTAVLAAALGFESLAQKAEHFRNASPEGTDARAWFDMLRIQAGGESASLQSWQSFRTQPGHVHPAALKLQAAINRLIAWSEEDEARAGQIRDEHGDRDRATDLDNSADNYRHLAEQLRPALDILLCISQPPPMPEPVPIRVYVAGGIVEAIQTPNPGAVELFIWDSDVEDGDHASVYNAPAEELTAEQLATTRAEAVYQQWAIENDAEGIDQGAALFRMHGDSPAAIVPTGTTTTANTPEVKR